MNLEEVVFAVIRGPWLLGLSVTFLINSCLEAGTHIIIGRNRSTDYKAELEIHLQALERASTESRRKIQNLDLSSVFLYEGRLVRMSSWSVLFFWTWLGLLVALLVMNWRWTLILLVVTIGLFFLPLFRKAGLLLAKPLHRPVHDLY